MLLFVLGRRLGMHRSASAAAVLVFALSPLALQYHRTVYIDNVATPWLLAAFVLVLSRRQQLAGFVGAERGLRRLPGRHVLHVLDPTRKADPVRCEGRAP